MLTYEDAARILEKDADSVEDRLKGKFYGEDNEAFRKWICALRMGASALRLQDRWESEMRDEILNHEYFGDNEKISEIMKK